MSAPPATPEDPASDSTASDASAIARLFARGSWPETARIAEILRKETLGGALLLLAAAAALIWANSPWSAAYESLRDAHVGPGVLHLNLSLETWAADGLLGRPHGIG